MKTGHNIPQGRFCWTCRNWRDSEEMANSSKCDTCYYSEVSMVLSENRHIKRGVRRIKGLTSKRCRYVNCQIKRIVCGDCGARFFVGSDFMCHGMRLVQLNCDGMDAHSYYALIDMTCKIRGVYRTGLWVEMAGVHQDPDIPF
jgi:hypothetical protein